MRNPRIMIGGGFTNAKAYGFYYKRKTKVKNNA